MILGAWAALAVGGAARAQDAAGTTGTAAQASGSASTTATTPTTATSTTTTSAAAGDAALQKTLQQTYDKCVAATKKRDESVLTGVRTRDFVYKEANGKTYTRDQVENNERQAMLQVQTIQSLSSQVNSVTRANGKVTANVRESFVGTILDAQNKTHVMNMTTTTRDVWIADKSGWKLQSVQVVGRQDTRDGKTFDPGATPTIANNQNANARNANGNYNNNNGYRAASYRMPRIHAPKIKRGS